MQGLTSGFPPVFQPCSSDPCGLLATQTLLLQPDFRAAGAGITLALPVTPAHAPVPGDVAFTLSRLLTQQLNKLPGLLNMPEPGLGVFAQCKLDSQ